jgi:hypothetical protein
VLSLAAGSLAVVSPPTLPWSHQADLANRLTAPQSYVTTMVVEQVKRKVYPYSIVPGGAENLFAAKRAMTDPAIKAHYASVGVDLSQLKEVKLTANLSGYVSYRWGDKIYWTAKKITLRAGEKVFTDGTHVVRARCLNCYSMLPMQPTRPHEPTELALDAPVEMPVTVYTFPLVPLVAPALPVPPGELTPSVPVLPAGGPITGKVPGGGIWFPLIPIIPPIHHHPGNGPTSPGTPSTPPGGGGGTPTPPVVPPVAVVPEPRYGWAFLAALFALGLTIRTLRERKPN